jgi:leucine dehydrogenase
MWPYASDDAAIADALRLSRGMTYKAAIAGVELGGGKSVIIGDSHTEKRPELLHAMGRQIDKLGGRYITGEDIGTNPDDMAEIKKTTRYVTCLHEKDGGYGDPAPMTALGVFQAMVAGAEAALGCADLAGLRVAVQGIGNVGYHLCRLLAEAGATLIVCDVFERNRDRAVEDFGAAAVAPDSIYDSDAEIFAPCAMGGVLDDDTVPRLKARVVAGGANNQLGEHRHGAALAERDIVYLPDYVANGGGLVCVAAEWYGDPREEVEAKVRAIYDTCVDIIGRAHTDGTPTSVAADRIAKERFRGPSAGGS